MTESMVGAIEEDDAVDEGDAVDEEDGVEEEDEVEEGDGEEDGVEEEDEVEEGDGVDEVNWDDGRVIGKSRSNSSLPSRVKTYTEAVSNFFGDVGMAEVKRIILK
ncbi:MAG: hypothetical protein PVG08_19575 [Desulfobacterales bacterium]|jgi:hypothetical protein